MKSSGTGNPAPPPALPIQPHELLLHVRWNHVENPVVLGPKVANQVLPGGEGPPALWTGRDGATWDQA